jgi:hypothetical protein
LLGKKESVQSPQTDPLHPDFSVDAWLRESQKYQQTYANELNPCFPTTEGLRQGISDNGGAQPQTDADRRAS